MNLPTQKQILQTRKRLLGGAELEDSKDEVLLRRLWAIIDQVRDVFLRPELIEGILMRKK